MLKSKVSRRRALQLGAAAAALPLVHIRTAGAAGRLTIGFWDHWVPVGNDATRKMVAKWEEQTKTEVVIDFITSVGNKNLLTIAAESQARTGHDILAFPTWEVLNNARNLEPVDDVVKRLVAKYGSLDPIMDYLAKSEGVYRAMPTFVGSQNKPCCARFDIFKEQVGLDLREMCPAGETMGPSYDQWTWDTFLVAAEKCHKAGYPFGLPMGTFSDAVDWVGAVFRSNGAQLVDEKGKITVKSDQVKSTLEWFKKLCQYLPGDVYSWDDASNNRSLISGKAALIMNPPSAWATAKKDAPKVAENCWTFPTPAGSQGRYIPYLPYFWGVWSFARNKPAAKELIEWLMQREQVEPLVTAVSGYDLPPFASMANFPVWQNEGPPPGTISNYPTKPSHKVKASIAAVPAPPEVAVQIYNQATMTKMIARVAQSNEPIERVVAWAQGELEGFTR